MRDTKKYEAYLRPILERLKKIDGRAPVSIMTCNVDPKNPQLAKWIKEGLSIEVHTIDHPCPLLQGGDFDKAKSTYDRCVDLMSEIPGNKPVAFRMPCCDSRNTPSPRFWMEIFNKRTEKGNYLQIDSSVFNVFTSADKELPRESVYDDAEREGEAPAEPNGPAASPQERRPPRTERFRKYIPFPSFVNTIENYPYPYVIGKLCWEFPCMVPSDWEAQNLHRPNNPKTVDDMKAALDATVIKQGVFNMVFHPHGWIRNDQIVELIDYAQEKYGKRVKFLTFREAIERLNGSLLGGQSLRDQQGRDNGVRILDLNDDGFLDVVIGNDELKQTRVWAPLDNDWHSSKFPTTVVEHGSGLDAGSTSKLRFGILDGRVTAIHALLSEPGWYFDGQAWVARKQSRTGLPRNKEVRIKGSYGVDFGERIRDLDGDGNCEFIKSNGFESEIFQWNNELQEWRNLEFTLPTETSIVLDGGDAGLRFVDVNQDGKEDVIFSNESHYSLHLFDSVKTGWSIKAMAGKRGDKTAIPIIARGIPRGEFPLESKQANNGSWFHSGHLWVQNEDTNRLPDFVDRLSFADMLKPLAKREATLKLPAVPIGAAKIDITPDYPMRLSGYGSRKMESEGVAQKLWAKALAIGGDEGEGAAILITVENCGMTPAIRNRVAKTLEEKAKIRNERLAISVATHTRRPASRIGRRTFSAATSRRISRPVSIAIPTNLPTS
jgi:hypothetical protein